MNKFTLFTLFLSSIIVVIVAEIMVNEYLRTPYSLEGAASVLHSSQNSQQQSAQSQQLATVQPSAPAQNTQVSSGSLTSLLLQKSGLQDYTLQAKPYGGKLFDQIQFSDLNFIPSFESHLMKNQIVLMASFYEFNPGSVQSAQEVYNLVKQKSSAEIGVIINETNSFGDGSFYVNYFQYPEKVFVVFRKGTRVFAFTYNKEIHGAMAKLIGLL